MISLLGAIALVSIAVPAAAAAPPTVIFQATSADRATGFRSMAECEAALGRSIATRAREAAGRQELRGTAFNRRAGNITRCEMIEGEPVVVVYPTGRQVRAQR